MQLQKIRKRTAGGLCGLNSGGLPAPPANPAGRAGLPVPARGHATACLPCACCGMRRQPCGTRRGSCAVQLAHVTPLPCALPPPWGAAHGNHLAQNSRRSPPQPQHLPWQKWSRQKQSSPQIIQGKINRGGQHGHSNRHRRNDQRRRANCQPLNRVSRGSRLKAAASRRNTSLSLRPATPSRPS